MNFRIKDRACAEALKAYWQSHYTLLVELQYDAKMKLVTLTGDHPFWREVNEAFVAGYGQAASNNLHGSQTV